MWYATTLMVTAAVMVMGAALSSAFAEGDIPLLAFAIPALFLQVLAVSLYGFLHLA
ncbi:hypothetical protein [Grimontia sedimenti]|uniref:hypothetical protein n=1 Tax=Grimontia sedimenti TaxID=2711294 RepID=UPI001F2331F2|nr:hypothetical protein [Grimontia sedimenti]